MTDHLLPAGLAGLPAPWNLTSDAARRTALAEGSAEAATVLDRVLGELPALLAAEPDDDELPGELGHYFDFTAAWLAESIAVLDDVTVPALTGLLRERIGETDPAGAAALGRRWLAVEARQLAAQSLATAAPGEVAAVLGRHLGRLDPGMATYLLASLRPVCEAPLLGLLESVAADEALDAQVRDQARRMLVASRESP